jgi:hypothetical protein
VSAPSRGEAAAHARPPCCEHNLRATSWIAAKTKQIVRKEIRGSGGKFPELVTQLVPKYGLVKAQRDVDALMKGRHI